MSKLKIHYICQWCKRTVCGAASPTHSKRVVGEGAGRKKEEKGLKKETFSYDVQLLCLLFSINILYFQGKQYQQC